MPHRHQPATVPDSRPASAESHGIFNAAHTHNITSHALQETPQVRPVQALLAAIDAETDPDRRSEALERTVESVSDADLPAMLDSLARDGSPGGRSVAANSLFAAGRKPTRLPQPRGPRNCLKAPPAAPRSNKLPSHGPTPTCPPPPIGCARCLKATANRPRPSASLTKPPGPTRSRRSNWRARFRPRLSVMICWFTPSANGPAPIPSLPPPGQWKCPIQTCEHAWSRLQLSLWRSRTGPLPPRLPRIPLTPGKNKTGRRFPSCNAGHRIRRKPQLSWVSQFPDIPSRDAAVQNLLAIWTAQDAEAAGNWVRELPTGSLRDAAVAAYAQALADRDRTSTEDVARRRDINRAVSLR